MKGREKGEGRHKRTRETHLAVSGWPGRGEAISGVRDVDGGPRQRGSTNVEGRPGRPRPGATLPPGGADHVAPGDGARPSGQLGPRPLVSVGRPRLVTSTVGGFTHGHHGADICYVARS